MCVPASQPQWHENLQLTPKHTFPPGSEGVCLDISTAISWQNMQADTTRCPGALSLSIASVFLHIPSFNRNLSSTFYVPDKGGTGTADSAATQPDRMLCPMDSAVLWGAQRETGKDTNERISLGGENLRKDAGSLH